MRKRIVLGVIWLLLAFSALPIGAQERPPELESIYQRGLRLYEAGKYAETVPIAEEYLAVAEAKFGQEHPQYATGLGYLAHLQQALNRPSDAERLMRRALAINEKSLGALHPSVAISLNNLAALLQATNRHAEAEPLMRRALAIDEKSFGPKHLAVATRLNNLGQLLEATNRLAEAEPLMRRSLAINESSFPSIPTSPPPWAT